MVSFLGQFRYEFPCPIPLPYYLGALLDETVDDKYYIKGEAADKLCSQIVQVERERERERVSRTVRTGGRASLDGRHTWDVINVVCNKKTDYKADQGSVHDPCEGLQRVAAEPRKYGGRSFSGVYTKASSDFQRGGLQSLSRSIKADNDAGVAEYGFDITADRGMEKHI